MIVDAPVSWAPDRILASPQAMQSIAALGQVLREVGYVNRGASATGGDRDVVEWAAGQPRPADVAAAALGGADGCDALLRAGGADRLTDGTVALRFEVLAGAGAMAILPRPGPSPLRNDVYAGPDTWLLVERAWRAGLGGHRAVDLGSGTGLVAAFLASRYRLVVATDVSTRAASTVAVGRALLDPATGARMSVSMHDVGRGLRPRTFDLVTANTPWVPTSGAGDRIYADGGPTGMELPERFLREGAALLAADGVLVLLCVDLRFDDGRAPLLEVAADLEAEGFATRVDPTPPGHACHAATAGAAGFLPGLESASHVTVVLHRPQASKTKQ